MSIIQFIASGTDGMTLNIFTTSKETKSKEAGIPTQFGNFINISKVFWILYRKTKCILGVG